MASGPRFYMPKAVALDAAGVTVPGACLNFYITGSVTRTATFNNQTLTVANPNPVVADASGVFPDIFLNPAITYKVVFTGPDDGITAPVVLWTADPVDEAWTVNPSGFFYQTFSFLTGAPPLSQQTIGAYNAIFQQEFFPNFDGTSAGFVQAVGHVTGVPSGATDFVIGVYKNSFLLPLIGAITISKVTGAFTFATVSGLPINLDAGDYLFFVAPATTDPTCYNISFTLPGKNLQFTDVGVLGGSSGGGGGGGDVNGPGASTSGHLVVWTNTAGTLIGDAGGPPGTLAFLNSITASQVSDFSTAVETDLASMLVQGTNVTITHNTGAHTFTISATGSGGGGITGPGTTVSGDLVTWNSTTGVAVADSGCTPSANAYTFLAAANFAAMRTALGLGTAATQNTGTSGANVPLLSAANTWTLAQTLTVAPVFGDAAGTRTALGLGTAAVQNVAFFAQVANNLSDLANIVTARGNLGLGSAATHAATDFEPAGAYSGNNAQTGAAYTLVLADQGQLVTMNNASANTLTIPTNASVAFPVLARIDLASIGAGQTTIAPAGGVTLLSASGLTKLRVQYSGGSLVKLATNTWLLVGDLA